MSQSAYARRTTRPVRVSQSIPSADGLQYSLYVSSLVGNAITDTVTLVPGLPLSRVIPLRYIRSQSSPIT